MVVGSGTQRGGDRGQLVLIAAILLAVTVIGTVVLLNTVHSSPNVKAQTDAQSLSGAERTTAQIQGDLETVFAATNTTENEQYPFVKDESKLNETVAEYESQSVKLLSTNKSALLSIGYKPKPSERGNFSAGELDSSFASPKVVMENAKSIPSLSVASDGEVGIEFAFGPSGPTDQDVKLDGTSTTVAGDSCSALADEELTLDFNRGSGVIRDESGGVCVVDLYEPEGVTEISVTITVSSGSGSFALSGVDPDTSYTSGTFAEDVIVNPVFEMEYIDPNVEYRSEFMLFGGEK
jgi:hypothetical protein